MVVTCEKCHTRFNLDEQRLTGSRVKARCSRCQHIFWVEREEEIPAAAYLEDEEHTPSVLEAPGREAGPGPEPFAAEAEPGPSAEEIAAQIAARAALPKPSLLLTAGARRSPWPWVISLTGGLAAGILVGCAIMWFWGYGWMAQKIHVQGSPTLSPAAKAAGIDKMESASPPLAPPAGAVDLKDLEIVGQEERYRGLVNRKGGQLLLIQGKVKNASSQPRGPIQLKAVLTDPKQKSVNERDFYAGTVVFDDELQNLDPEEINRWLDTPGGRAQKKLLGPGEDQSFMVVFFGAPQNLAGYGYKMQIIKGPVADSQSRRQ
ncbi:MAG: DUF3426 domain-containing protein [Desulfobaccales bacterium]